MMEKCRYYSEWMVVVGIVLLMSLLPFRFGDIHRIVLYFLAASYLFDYFINKRWQQWTFSREKIAYLFMILFFLLTPLHQLFDISPTQYYHYQLELRLSFLIVGVVGFLGITNKLKPSYCGVVMLITGAAVFIYVIVQVLNCGNYSGLISFAEQYNIYRNKIATHMVIDLYVNLAIIAGLFVLKNASKSWLKISVGVLLLINFVATLMSSGRVGVATMMIIIVSYVLFRVLNNNNRKIIVPLLGVLLTIAVVVVILNPRFESIKDDLRWKIWRYSFEMIEKKPIFGYGVSLLSEEYVRCAYLDEGMNGFYIEGLLQYDEFKDLPRNLSTISPHNTYLQVWLEHGIIGLIVFLGMLLSFAFVRTDDDKIYLWLTLFAIGVQAMFDCIDANFRPLMICFVLLMWTSYSRPSLQPR